MKAAQEKQELQIIIRIYMLKEITMLSMQTHYVSQRQPFSLLLHPVQTSCSTEEQWLNKRCIKYPQLPKTYHHTDGKQE
jgi:hypothetical protein